MMRPIEGLLADAAAARGGGRVLDVGCGTGATTVAIARRLGDRAEITGVDISAPMLEAARARAEREGVPARFLLADAGSHDFEPGGLDLLVSRFGVMFFADPVAAFANLRRAAAADAALRLVVWRDPAENPFMTAAPEAAAPLLPDLPPPQPGAPGPFGLADRKRLREILTRAGWPEAEIEPLDVACSLPERLLLPYLTRVGPVSRALREADEATRSRVIEAIHPAYDRFLDGDEARFTAACWLITRG